MYDFSFRYLLQVRDLIITIKHWRNCVDWGEWKWRPGSYLLSLLLVRAYENACFAAEGSLPSSKDILIRFVKLVESTQRPRLENFFERTEKGFNFFAT